MKKNFIDLSGKIDTHRLDAIEAISKVASSIRIPFFLIGASARNLLLISHDIPIYRATLDIDFGVRVPNWNNYYKLKENIRVNMTLIFSATQALLAAKAGAAYASPFVGRLDDISHWGMDLVEQILTIYENYDFETEVIVASIRNPLHVLEAALMGADIATVPFKVIEQLIKHPLTDVGVERFLKDWKKVGKK